MVVSQQLVQEVNGLVAHESLVFGGDEAVPGLLREAPDDVVVLGIKLYLVLVEVVEEVVGAENLGDFHKLIRIALAVEEGLLPEYHGREHCSETPHIQAVVVLLEINEQLGALEVSARHTYVILGSRVVEFGQTPVDKTELGRSDERRSAMDPWLGRGHRAENPWDTLTFLFS